MGKLIQITFNFFNSQIIKDVYTANNFHLQLGQAAKLNGLTVQYCMPVVSDIIASLFNPVASYIRLSDDYSTNPQQWKIGRVSIMAWSLGLIAFKDTFWTISNQPNNPYNFTESNPQLNVIVASLSGAGVAIGDGIGMTNRSLVMQTCTEEGILLRTDKPATAIDETFLSSKHSNRPSGEVWSTYSTLFEPAFKTYYVLAANLTNSYTLYPHSLGILIEPYFVYEYGAENQSFASFDQTHPLIIPACPAKDDFAPFHYFIVVPQVKQSDWIVLGETNKFVAISNQRFERINFLDSSSIKLVIKGSLNEKVTISLYNIKKNNFFQVICLFQNSNKKKMILSCNSFFECSCQ